MAEARPVVATTSAPVDWLVRQLAGDRVERRPIFDPSADPRSSPPSVESILQAREADLILAQGAGYEPWMATASLPRSRTFLATKGLDLMKVESRTHSHGPGGEHSHRGDDPHTFVDPATFAEQAILLHGALSKLLPRQGELLDRNLESLRRELDTLDRQWAAVLAPLADTESFALASDHPSYGYLARRHGLSMRSFEIGGPSAGPSDWAREVRSEGALPILFRHRPPSAEGSGVTEAGGDSESPDWLQIHIDPMEIASMEGGEPTYAYVERQRSNIERIRLALAAEEAR